MFEFRYIPDNERMRAEKRVRCNCVVSIRIEVLV